MEDKHARLVDTEQKLFAANSLVKDTADEKAELQEEVSLSFPCV